MEAAVNVAAESTRGRGSAVTLLPLFRSQTQALVLARLLLGPGEESLTDLARRRGYLQERCQA